MFIVDIIKFDDMYASSKEATSSKLLIIVQKSVCLNISSFMLSFPLSFIIDLYNLIPTIC